MIVNLYQVALTVCQCFGSVVKCNVIIIKIFRATCLYNFMFNQEKDINFIAQYTPKIGHIH